MKVNFLKLFLYIFSIAALTNCAGKKDAKNESTSSSLNGNVTSPVSNDNDNNLTPTPANPVTPVLVSEPISNISPGINSSVDPVSEINNSPELTIIDTNGSVQVISEPNQTPNSEPTTITNSEVTSVVIPNSIIQSIEEINSVTDIILEDSSIDYTEDTTTSDNIAEDENQNGNSDTISGDCMNKTYIGIIWFNNTNKTKAVNKKVLRCNDNQFQTIVHHSHSNSKQSFFYRIIFFSEK